MASLALILDRHTEDALLPDILEHGHSVAARLATAREFVALIGTVTVDALVTGASHATLDHELLAACDARGIRIIALAANALERRHAAELGLYEVLDAGARWEEVEALLVVRVDHSAPFSVPDDGGVPAGVVVVWGPVGAPGRSTVAIGIAAEVAASGRSVVLVDADTYGGTIGPALGMLDEAPGFAAACRLAGADSLSHDEFERIAHHYRSRAGGFRVLTGISRASRWPELGPRRVAAVLEACRTWAEVVVVDVGFSLENDEEIASDLFAPHRNGTTLAALRAADRIVAVGTADPVGLPRFIRGYGELVEAVDAAEPPRIDVLMNRVRARAVGSDASGQVRATLRRFGGIDAVHIVPDDQRAHDDALLAGRTLRDAAPKSPARLALARFVAERLAPPAAPKARRRRRAGPATEAATGRERPRYSGERVDAQ